MKLMLALAAIACASFAQDQATQEKVVLDQMMAHAKTVTLEAGVMGPAVKGAPYSAEEIHETTQVLADGTRIHNETTTKVYRDSEGRVRRETPEQVEIWDPTTNTSFVQNRKEDTVRKQKMSYVFRTQTGEGGQPVTASVKTNDSNVQIQVAGDKAIRGMIVSKTEAGDSTASKPESLGQRSTDGIVSEGARTTNTIAAGAIGNDRPIDVVSERWYSPELKVVTMTRKSDPRTGEEIVRLTNIVRGEQDPSLFQAPAMPHPRQEEQ